MSEEKKVYRIRIHEPKNVIAGFDIEAETEEEAHKIAEEKYHRMFPLKHEQYNPTEEESA